MLDLLNSFPDGFIPNTAQEYILTEISKAITLRKKFIIINAPTATGKSFISKTIANYSSEAPENFIEFINSKSYLQDGKSEGLIYEPFGTAILTVTKALQDQYTSLFPDGDALKGQCNYPCIKDESLNCENGLCNYVPKHKKNCECPYKMQRSKTLANKCSFYNYSMFNSLASEVKHRQFIICDEASELEDEIVSAYTFEFDTKSLKKVFGDDPVIPTPSMQAPKEVIFDWINEVSDIASLKYENVRKEITNKKKGKKAVLKKDVEKFSFFKRISLKLKELVNSFRLSEYLVERTAYTIKFVPYNIEKLANKIFAYGNTVILMSATIVNHRKFAKTLGIEDYYYIEAETTLDAEKAPIKCLDSADCAINFRNKAILMPKLAKLAIDIANKHKDEKGIIHTHSMEILNEVKKATNDKRFLFREGKVTNEAILNIHSDTDAPTVLVSPSMTHGVDLKGDLGKFQIIIKAPFPPLNDIRIKKKCSEDYEWYIDKMLSTLIQMSGRCNRIESDYCTTYALDSNIIQTIKRNTNKLPKYFLKRIS